MSGDTKITMYRGDTHLVAVTVSDADGNAIDVTEADCMLSVASAPGAEYVLQKTGAATSGTEGQIEFEFAPEDTDSVTPGRYQFDIQITLTSTAVYTVARGIFELMADITRPVPAR